MGVLQVWMVRVQGKNELVKCFLIGPDYENVIDVSRKQ